MTKFTTKPSFDRQYRQWKKNNQIAAFKEDASVESEMFFRACALVGSILLAGIMIFSCSTARAEVYDAEAIADAIYIIEGKERAKKPFGILSVKCDGYEDCRRICLNTIENSFTRWQAAGSQGDFLDHLWHRYAPPSAHPLNKNWGPNLRSVLARGAK